ncbi:MAG: DUF2225 domain-containing protein [Lachnospiraceae bacterium]|nr:DUF2225 domain-containing protein [Lachnospiraceae bacterium]
MAGLLSGLSSLGLGNLENASIYEEPKEEKTENKNIVDVPEIQEKDLIFDRSYECPVCDSKITSKVMKTGKAKLLSTDKDLRPVYEGIDAQKYDVVTCPKCGFSALNRYFKPMSGVHVKLIRENISKNVHMKPYSGEIYTYEEALERYKLSLACAVVKQAKASEKAYICLKSAWLLRGWQEALAGEDNSRAQMDTLKEEEKEYLKNALEGFTAALASESFPMCGMDENTLNYLIAVLAFDFGKYDVSTRLLASILTSPSAGIRMKDKARELKDELLAELKKAKG